jgi:hypothetical protein
MQSTLIRCSTVRTRRTERMNAMRSDEHDRTSTNERSPALYRSSSRHALLRPGMLVLLVMGVTISACHGREAEITPPLTPPDESLEIDEAEIPSTVVVEPALVWTLTYDGSGELVHPDAAVFPESWRGRRYWVSGTPYPTGNPKYENPSIYQGYKSRQMMVPAGVDNPLARPASGAYLSDPDLLYDPDRDELRMYYRQTADSSDQISLLTSADGVHWSAPARVLTGERYGIISPSIVRESASSWRMWSVSAVAQGCYSLVSEMTLQQRHSTDGVTWSEPEPVNMRVPGRVAWHWDVQYVQAKQEYWALVAAFPSGTSCSETAVFFAHSADGTTWSVAPTPLLGRGQFAPMNDLVYRSTFHYHEASDAVSVWFSGARIGNGGFHFSTASARYPYPELIRRVNGPSAMIIEREIAGQESKELRAARTSFESHFP